LNNAIEAHLADESRKIAASMVVSVYYRIDFQLAGSCWSIVCVEGNQFAWSLQDVRSDRAS
jgi:hypothetical protein